MKVETIGGRILAVTIVVCFIWTGTATGETNTYKFEPDQSTVIRSFFTSDTYTLIGAFQLTVDANSGSFDWVDATFSDDPNLQTGDLRELFYMDELVGDVVNDTTIEFELPPGHPVLQSYDIHITVTFQNDQVHLAGYRNPLMVGEPGYTLDAVADVMTIFYVDAVNGDDNNDGLSPETAFATIQKSIDSAQNRDLVIVLPGTYTGSGNRDIDFKGKAITVRSENGPNTCIVDCEAQGRGFYFYTGENADSVLEGLTILNGSVFGMGAGIFCAGSSPSIRNCIIGNCSILGTGAGGGIYCDGDGPAINNCTIIDNTALEGSGIYLLNCNAMINSCIISHNGTYDSLGGGIYCRDSSPTITDCTITENNGDNGGGMYCEFSSLSITDCDFVRNEADYGGGGGIMCTDSDVAISRCTFSENGTDADYSDGGGAAYLVRTGGTIAGCSFIDNETIGGSGAGIWCDDQSDPVISDCSFVSHRDSVVTCSDGSNSILSNCSFTGNSSTSIQCWNGSVTMIASCTIVGNSGPAIESGIDCTPMIVNCRITGNQGTGVWTYGGGPTIINCTIADNPGHCGINSQAGDVTVSNSIVWGNTGQNGDPNNNIVLQDGGTASVSYSDVQGVWPGVGNINADPWFIDPDGGNYRVMPISQCINTGDNTAVPPSILTDLDGNPRIVNGKVDMGAYEFQGIQILYVDADAPAGGDGKNWATAYNYLQDALFNAIPPAEIRVAQGIYKPHLNTYSTAPPSREDTFQLKSGVTIKGGYAGLGQPNPDARDISLYETVLSGDMNGDDEPNFINNGDNSLHVVTGSGTGETAVLDGFTITGGNTNGGGKGHVGGGMYIKSGTPTLVDCTFSQNSAGKEGGGIFNDISSPILTRCTFNRNVAGDKGGGMYNEGTDGPCNPTLVNCTFSGNSAETSGGGMYNEGEEMGECNPILSDCLFNENSAEDGGGMYNFEANPTITNCNFTGNFVVSGGGCADGAGMYNHESNPIVSNCTFSGNQACRDDGGCCANGAGMYNDGSSPTITGCTFDGNRAYYGLGGGICICRQSNPVINDCTFTDNYTDYGGGIGCGDNSSPAITNCTISGNSAYLEGGGICCRSESSPTITNCMIVSNDSEESRSGGIACLDSSPTIANCTFVGNYSGLFCADYSSPVVSNCILWSNRTFEIEGSAIVMYSDVQDGWPGLGNIDADPCFVDTATLDYHLLPGSPCIDAGDPDYMAEPNETDLDGNPRVIGGRIDMGAYEFCGPIYIDDDAPDDPGPGDPQVSDPLEDGTEDHPFDTIQEGINMAKDGYIVLVRQGSYFELTSGNSIDFLGKIITLTSSDPTDWDIVDNTVIRGYVQFSGTEGPNCKFTGFKISNLEGAIYGNHTHATIGHCNISGNGACGVTVIKDCDGTISNCLITDNTTFALCGIYPVVFGCNGLIKNCTIANNESGLSVGTAKIENCIIYNNTGSQLAVTNGNKVDISYSNVQNGLAGVVGDGHVNWGPGNIDTDPCFVRLGYWIMDEVTLIEGDYHLRSEGWRWNTEGTSWTYDFVTSRCVDAGNPGSPLRGELISVPRDPDNVWGINLRINMGAYGGTGQASMPPHDWALLADLNNDGTANFVDFAYQAQDWLKTAPEQPGDLNRDGVLNTMDLALLAEEWLRVTDLANQPPVVYITQPTDGCEFCWLTESVQIEADVSDVDGSVVKVEFFVNGAKIGEDNNGTDGWLYVTSFNIGTYTLTAKATDNKGAKATSPPVKIKAVECQ